MITLPRATCIDLGEVLKREWLVGNGIGGYASSTPAGINTRRYHGLLVAALKPPVDRTVLLSSIEEEVQIGDRTFYMGGNEYPDGRIFPDGFVHIEEFRLENGLPIKVFQFGGALFSKTVWMERGHNTTYVRYSYLEGPERCSLLLKPMCNYRDYHGMTTGSFDWNFGVDAVEGGCKITAKPGAVPYWLTLDKAEFTPTGVWYWRHVYRQEVERGYDDTEDLYLPGVLRIEIEPGESFTLVASTEPPDMTRTLLDGALDRELARQRELLRRAGVPESAERDAADDPSADPTSFVAQLVRAADSFIVERTVETGGEARQVPTVLAGYHWFTDWGRDTMISLPGLCLPLGRATDIAETLSTFAYFEKDGLIPNNFPDSGEPPGYNTADGTLWMFVVADRAAQAGDSESFEALLPVLTRIIDRHIEGTRYGIGMDPADCLLRAGEEGYQLTWMDVKIDDWVVTPRIGKPVEINALWIKALEVMSGLTTGKRRARGAPNYSKLAAAARASFRKRFWYEAGGYLYDVVDGPGGDDPSLRPNQVIALGLIPGLVSEEQGLSVLKIVREKLLTPYGLRTLSPDDPRYAGRYTGDRKARDSIYHQGTVWAWLLGPYFDAVRAIEGDEAARQELERILPALREHMGTAGLGTISEIFDGDPPHTPRGCISQAWSVAEVLRQVWGPGKLL